VKDHTSPLLADRLNHEPVVLLGCNTSEVSSLAAVCTGGGALVAIPTGIALGAAINASVGLFLGFAIFFLSALGGSYFALQWLQRHKEEHGDHYYRELLHCRKNDFGFGGSVVHQESQRYVRGKAL